MITIPILTKPPSSAASVSIWAQQHRTRQASFNERVATGVKRRQSGNFSMRQTNHVRRADIYHRRRHHSRLIVIRPFINRCAA